MADNRNTQDEENLENNILASTDGAPLDPENQPPITDTKMVPISDGSIPIDSTGISSGNYNAISPIGESNIIFQGGNYNQITSLPQIISNKIQTVTNTIIVLWEVGLIELLGSTSMYKRDVGNCDVSIDDNNQSSINFYFKYIVDLWIAQDIDYDAIQHDASYLMEKIKIVPGINISQCTIDCSDGSVVLQGYI